MNCFFPDEAIEEASKELVELEHLKHKLLAASYTEHGSDLGKLFDRLDHDHNGTIDLVELSTAVKKLLPSISELHLKKLMSIADTQGVGVLNKDDFVGFITNRESTTSHSMKQHDRDELHAITKGMTSEQISHLLMKLSPDRQSLPHDLSLDLSEIGVNGSIDLVFDTADDCSTNRSSTLMQTTLSRVHDLAELEKSRTEITHEMDPWWELRGGKYKQAKNQKYKNVKSRLYDSTASFDSHKFSPQGNITFSTQQSSPSKKDRLRDIPTHKDRLRDASRLPEHPSVFTGSQSESHHVLSHFTSEDLFKLKHKLLAASYTTHGADLSKLFDRIDVNRSGSIDIDELSSAVRRLLPDTTVLEMEDLMRNADVKGLGCLDKEEFIDFINHRDASGSIESPATVRRHSRSGPPPPTQFPCKSPPTTSTTDPINTNLEEVHNEFHRRQELAQEFHVNLSGATPTQIDSGTQLVDAVGCSVHHIGIRDKFSRYIVDQDDVIFFTGTVSDDRANAMQENIISNRNHFKLKYGVLSSPLGFTEQKVTYQSEFAERQRIVQAHHASHKDDAKFMTPLHELDAGSLLSLNSSSIHFVNAGNKQIGMYIVDQSNTVHFAGVFVDSRPILDHQSQSQACFVQKKIDGLSGAMEKDYLQAVCQESAQEKGHLRGTRITNIRKVDKNRRESIADAPVEQPIIRTSTYAKVTMAPSKFLYPLLNPSPDIAAASTPISTNDTNDMTIVTTDNFYLPFCLPVKVGHPRDSWIF